MTNDRQRILPIDDDLLLRPSTPKQAASPLARIEEAVAGASHGREISIRETVAPTALFLYLRWLDHQEQEREAMAAFDGESFVSALPQGLLWRQWAALRGGELTDFIRQTLLPRVSLLDKSALAVRVRQLEPIQAALLRLPDSLRDELVDVVGSLPWQAAADSQAAESLLARMIARGATPRSAFYTPPEAVDLVLELAQPQPGERVYDPCFGSGSLLAAAARRLREDSKRLPPARWEEIRRESLFGVEIDPIGHFVGTVRVILSGIDQPGLELGNALDRPRIKNPAREGFDCIIANPPWRGVIRGVRSTSVEIQTTSSEGLFLQHIAAALRPGGRAVVALPASFLSSAGPEKRVRKLLLEEFHVEGVISLPPRLFKPYADVESAVLVLKRGRPVTSVKFLRCEALASEGGSSSLSVALTSRQVGDRFRLGKPAEDLWFSSARTIANREWDLSAKRTGQEGLERVLDEIIRTDPQVRVLPLGEIAEVMTGLSYSRKDVLDIGKPDGADDIALALGDAIQSLPGELRQNLPKVEQIPLLVRAGDVGLGGIAQSNLALIGANLHARALDKAIKPGDVLLSVGGTIGKVGVVHDDRMHYVPSRNLNVIRPKAVTPVNSLFLAMLLRAELYQDWLSGHARGATIQSLSVKVVREIPIPLPNLPIQERVARESLEKGLDALNELLRVLTATELDPVALWLERNADALESLSAEAHSDGSVDILGLEGAPSGSTEARYLSAPSRRRLSDASPRLVTHALSLDVAELTSFIETSSTLPALENLARSFRTLRNELAHTQERRDPWLREWVFRTWEGLAQLEKVSQVPEGMGRLNILERSRSMLTTAAPDGKAEGTSMTHARRLTDRLARVLDTEIDRLFSKIQITPTLDRSSVVAGEDNAVTISLKNASPLALREFRCQAAPYTAELTIPYFAEGETKDLLLTVAGDLAPRLDFTVTWFAQRLDGKRVSGRIPLSLEVLASRIVAVDEEDLGPNPYITGTPVDRPTMFYGRTGIIDTIKRHLTNPASANVILLEGNRRAGKSSILWQLERQGELPGWVVARCDFQGAAGHDALKGIPTDQVFIHLARSIAEAGVAYSLKFWPPSEEPLDPAKPYRLEFRRAFSAALRHAAPFEVFKEFLESVVEQIRPRRLLLMLDEFDRIQEGIDSEVTSPQVPQNIRFLLNNYKSLSAILTGSRRMTQMRKEYWSVLFGLGHKIGVTAIDPADAARLVVEPSPKLVFPPATVERITSLCANQPFLIQRLCSQIFDTCARDGQRTVTLDIVELAALALVHGMEHFEAFWEFAADERARFILCIVYRLTRQDDVGPVTLPMIEDELEKSGVGATREELVGDELKKLVELEMIAMEKDGQYRLAVPLLALWISRNKDCEDQRERAVQETLQRSIR